MRVVACLPGDEAEPGVVLAAAADLARGLRATLQRVEDLSGCLSVVATRPAVTHLLFGPVGWRRWGEDLAALGRTDGRLALSWRMGLRGPCRGLTFQDGCPGRPNWYNGGPAVR